MSDGKGAVYVNISDKANIAVVDAKNLAVTAHYDVSSKGTGGSGLALDAKNHILFAYYRQPTPRVAIVNANNGNIITTLPTGLDVDTVAFNPATMEAISAEGGGSMTFIKENSPDQLRGGANAANHADAKTLTLDTKTNHAITMSAEFEPAPANARPRASGMPARGAVIPGSFTILMVGK